MMTNPKGAQEGGGRGWRGDLPTPADSPIRAATAREGQALRGGVFRNQLCFLHRPEKAPLPHRACDSLTRIGTHSILHNYNQSSGGCYTRLGMHHLQLQCLLVICVLAKRKVKIYSIQCP